MIDFLTEAPYIVRVLGSLLIIPIVNKLTGRTSLSILAGTLMLAFWTGHSPRSFAEISMHRLAEFNTFFLLLAIFQVIWLSSQMAATGIMRDLVHYVRNRVSKGVAMAILPAVIGLLPMPGGALFSAPLVESCDRNVSTSPLLKTLVNYWYRHLWEYWWPLYPGVLLAVEISGLSIGQFISINIAFSFFAIVAGYFFLLKKIPASRDQVPPEKSKALKRLILLSLPILMVISISLLVTAIFPRLSLVSRYIPIIIGILGAQTLLQILRPLDFKSWVRIILSQSAAGMVFVVVLVLIYGAFIDGRLPNGSLLMEHMRTELSTWGIPLFLIVILIPFISGFTTGISFAFVGASLPIVLSLLAPDAGADELKATVVLAFGAGYVGMLLSPVHVCLIVTNRYFKTRLLATMLYLLPLCAAILAGAVILHFIIK